MQVTPYLSFDGQCEAAFKFYERCFAGRLGLGLPADLVIGTRRTQPPFVACRDIVLGLTA